MNWQKILSILVPTFSFILWGYYRREKKADARLASLLKKTDERPTPIDKRADGTHAELISEIRDLRKDVQSLDSRISRIEG